ncbi:sucrose-specific PTS transporter subunit IIBC [Brooklawnia sp.]|uniref:sucrose-specific PTS transporter subunit IIBC n=1 Tax=Brooklawnia sp. TaxID=2699740 RepID=UPI00311EEFAD
MDHARVAQTVLQAVGGADNITAAAHCATRLRLVLQDEQLVDHAALDEDADIKGTFSAGGMFQVIVGPGDVDTVYEKLVKSGVREVSKDEAKQEGGKKSNPLVRLIKVLADVFVPILPALIAGGLMMALNNVLTAPGLFGPKPLVEMAPAITDVAAMINLFASAPFAFLPVLIGFSATKRFGGNPYLGAAMGAAMVMPALVNGWNVAAAVSDGSMTYWDLFGLQVAQAGYQGQVIPTLAVSFLLATIEKWLHRKLSGTVDFLVTPLVTMIVTGFLAFVIVGPATRILGDGITFGLQWLYDSTGFVGGLLFGLVYSPVVVTGLHQSFPAVELSLIAQGGSFIFPIASMANVAQGAATLAVFLCAGSGKLKGLAGASAASALMGITEPAIFGVNLRLRWPFFIAIGSAAVGGALVSIFNVKAIALGAAGLLGFVSISAPDIPMFLVSVLVTFAISFSVTFMYARSRGKQSILGTRVDETVEEEEAEREEELEREEQASILQQVPLSGAVDSTDFLVTAPLRGKLIDLADVKDPTFARGLLGPGAAIIPDGGAVVSPVNGEVIVAFPTGHAVGLRADSGVELLIHIGMDTVELKGKHFSSKVVKGQRVRRGEVLVVPDWDAISAAGYDLTTPIVVTNAAKYAKIEAAASGPVELGTELLEVVQKDPALA